MFEQSLLESGGKLKTKRGLTALISFGLQFALIGVILIVPLFFTEELPPAQLVTMLVAPPPPPPPPPPPAAAVQRVVKPVETDIDNGKLKTPTAIPKKIEQIVEDTPPPPVNTTGGVIGGVPGGIPGGTPGGVIGGIVTSTAPIPQLAPPKVVRVSSGVSAGMLVHKVQPIYPPLARQARIQGSVVLEATISKDGSIENLRTISGHPMLVPAAISAVKQWRYKPYLLNGEPVEVETTVQVNFTLSGG